MPTPTIQSIRFLFFLALASSTWAFVPQLPVRLTPASRLMAVMANGKETIQDSTVAVRAAATTTTTPSTETTTRRGLFQAMGVSLATAAAAMVVHPTSASATYSAFTRREQDWQERLGKGEVKISTARDLRRQLREIAPMNDEGSKIFCPNGTSSAVSPMMENKCSDERMAIPSVYGRTQDTVGNSIPGFATGYMPGMAAGGSSSIAAEIGGFPSYNAKTGR